jgi:hypothetical protein
MIIKSRLELMDWVYDNVPKETENYLDVSLFVYVSIKNNINKPSFGKSWADFLNSLSLAELINSAKDELQKNDEPAKT